MLACLVLIVRCVLTARFCSKLALPGNGTLSTEMVVYSTVVTATCLRGFIFADGNLSRSLECVDHNNSVSWIDIHVIRVMVPRP